MAEFAKTKAGVDASEKKTLGEGLFRKCDACGDAVKKEDFERNLEVCPACGFHFHLTAEQWVDLLADDGSWTALDTELSAGDPLRFIDSKAYTDRVEAARESTGVNDAILAGTARIDGRPVQLGVFVFRFMGGSMGSVVGEVITRMMERGAEHTQPVV
ncbi:MAG: acetyl-CoA carboxylase carboxyl transferase subunit beta, partial [Deltaproteobacteria bacterium]|nr:acetyl-CoA carboxylase carboxyl transferase subunit beta [Deltaproteobacteria bacterium]